jgi:hypothetical protein
MGEDDEEGVRESQVEVDGVYFHMRPDSSIGDISVPPRPEKR